MNTETKQKIIDLLLSTERNGVGELCAHMEETGFFESPCSGGTHLAKVGGLAEHSLNVYRIMHEVACCILGMDINHDSIIICSLLHDLGKCGDHGKQGYIQNMIKDGRPTKAEPVQRYKQSEDKPFKGNADLLYIPHEVRSIAIAQRFIFLTEEEEHAIYYHNGKYTHTGYDLKETQLQMLLHFADLWCSRVIETEKKPE